MRTLPSHSLRHSIPEMNDRVKRASLHSLPFLSLANTSGERIRHASLSSFLNAFTFGFYLLSPFLSIYLPNLTNQGKGDEVG